MPSRWRRVSAVFVLTFLISVTLSLTSNTALSYLPLFPSIVLLAAIVWLGIIFDIVGVAVTVANEEPFHAMASKRIPGSRQGVWLIRRAEQVANFCNDVVGDIAGTLSGAVAAGIIFSLTQYSPELNESLLNTIGVGLLAAVTVGGKAYGKGFAISYAADVVFQVARFLYWVERVLGVTICRSGKDKKKAKGRRGRS